METKVFPDIESRENKGVFNEEINRFSTVNFNSFLNDFLGILPERASN